MPAETQSPHHEPTDDRLPLTRYLRVSGEALLYFVLVLSPWAFGGVDPAWQFAIAIAVGLMTVLWLVRCTFYRRITIRPDGVTFGLGGLLCLSAFQLVPLPVAFVSVLSTARAEAHRSLIPERGESIGGEAGRDRPSMVSLSADPSLTRHFLAEVFVCLAVYVVARNWLATRGSIRRMAAILAANGVALALFAFAQFFTAKGQMYWTYPMPTAFGPFVCRNHYPFYAYLTLGLTVGLLLNQAKSEYSTVTGKGLVRAYQTVVAWFGNVSQSVGAVLLLTAATIIALSIPFSLSRGGMLTLVASGTFVVAVVASNGARKSGGGLLAAGVVVALVLGLGTWLGWGPIERRFATVEGGALADSRSDLWSDAVRLIPRYPLFGCGNNAFQRVEPTVRHPRGEESTNLVNDSVHNEYLEAVVEGGPLRLLFAAVLAVAPVVAAVRAYRRLHGRSVGSVALGMAFGLFAVALHSGFDFGIHIPAVALLAATVAAYSRAAMADPDFYPSRRMKTSGHDTVGVTEFDDPRGGRVRTASLLGPPALAVVAVVFIGTGLVVRQFMLWDRAERYATAAAVAAKEPGTDRRDERIALAAARAGLAPDDPEAHAALAKAHFDAIWADRTIPPDAGAWKPPVAKGLIEKHVLPGLLAARNAREASPYLPSPHMRFALYRDFCTSADPSAAYLERVQRLTPYDPEAWFASGIEAFSRNDLAAATADWRRSLALNGRQLVPIVRIASGKLSPADIRDKLLPDEPTVLLAAADLLYPDRTTQREDRAILLKRAKDLGVKLTRPDLATLIALARIEFERGDRPAALAAWRRAVDASPNNVSLRQQYADWLESEELYEPLVSELEWLRQHGFGGANVVDRLDAARHALDLKQIIDK